MRPRYLMFCGWALWATQGRFLSLLLLEKGLDGQQIGVIFAVPMLLDMFVPLLWGLLADKVLGHHLALTLSAVAGAALFAFLPLCTSFASILALRTAHEVTLRGIIPILDGHTMHYLELHGPEDEDEDGRRARWGRERSFGTVSWGVVHMAYGLLFERFAYERTMVVVNVLLSALFVGVVALDRRQQRVTYSKLQPAEADADKADKHHTDKQSADIDNAAPDDSESVGPGFDKAGAETRNVEAPGAEEGGESQLALEMRPLDAKGLGAVPEPQEETPELELASSDSGSSPVALFARRLFLDPYSCVFMLAVVVISMGSGLVENLVFLFFTKEIGASNVLLGVSVVVTVSIELPLLFYAPHLLRWLGPAPLLVIGLLAYSTRVIGYTLVPSEAKWLVLPLEVAHGITYACVSLAAKALIASIAPPGYPVLAQAALVSTKSLGSAIGVTAGSASMDSLGSTATYRGAGGIVFAMTCLFAVVHVVRGPNSYVRAPPVEQ